MKFRGLFASHALVQGAAEEAGTSTDLRDVEGDGTARVPTDLDL